jgi:hypothetical protein
MNTRSIVAPVAAFAFVMLAHVAMVHAHAPSGAYRAPRVLVSSASTLTDCPQPEDACRVARAAYPMFTVSEQTIVGSVTRSAPKARVWTCGAVEANRIGGSQRTCEWR